MNYRGILRKGDMIKGNIQESLIEARVYKTGRLNTVAFLKLEYKQYNTGMKFDWNIERKWNLEWSFVIEGEIHKVPKKELDLIHLRK